MKDFEKGLRCQDIHSGLRNVDPNWALIAPLEDTRIVGMAASLAAAIRGQDVIRDAQSLKVVAAEQLDVDSLAFNSVVELLDDAGLVTSVSLSGTKIKAFVENVPYFDDLYQRLGETWTEREPTQIEQQVVATVDRLASGPVPLDELTDVLGLEAGDEDAILRITTESDLVKVLELPDGRVVYSPFLAFENPDVLADVLSEHGSDRAQEEFAAVRKYQGLPLDESANPVLADAVARGLVHDPQDIVQ